MKTAFAKSQGSVPDHVKGQHANQLHFLGQLRLSSIGKITQKLRKSDMLDFVFSRKRESCQE